jgi:hypothetical protein
MPEKSLEARVAAIEKQMAGKTLETHFREHAELIDRRFAESFRENAELMDRLLAYRFEESDRKWDQKLAAGLAGLEERIDIKLEPIRTDLKRLTDAVLAVVARLP